MPELVAIDVAQGPSLPGLLDRIWSRGDAACVVDPRLGAAALTAQLDALSPTRHLTEEGEVPCRGGQGVEVGDALVVATSGSIAAPRAVLLTHDAVAASAKAT